MLKVAILMLFVSTAIFSQNSKVTDLPDISVIGSFLGSKIDGNNKFNVNEIEFSFQHMLYPSVKADIFVALHKEEDSEKLVLELEESYVTFLDLPYVIAPNFFNKTGIGAILGKKMINFGKINPLHPEQRSFIDRPVAVQTFLGGAESLAGQGMQISTLLPFSFFSQLEIGYWTVAAHEEHNEEATGEGEGDAGEAEDSHSLHGIEYENRLLNARLWNSFALSDSREIELGLSYLLSNTTADSNNEKPSLMGIDFSYNVELSTFKSLSFMSEFYKANYAGEGDQTKETQIGGFASIFYNFNSTYSAGFRLGLLGKHGDEGEQKTQYSIIGVRQLTETSKFRIQYNSGEEVEDAIYFQFIFGMGPHSHVLQ